MGYSGFIMLLGIIAQTAPIPLITTWDTALGTNVTFSNSDLTVTETALPPPWTAISESIADSSVAEFTIDTYTPSNQTTISIYSATQSTSITFSAGSVYLSNFSGDASDSSTIPDIAATDVIRFDIKASGVYITINGAGNSWYWDGVNGSIPTLTGVPATDTNPSAPTAVTGTKAYDCTVFGFGFESCQVTADFDV